MVLVLAYRHNLLQCVAALDLYVKIKFYFTFLFFKLRSFVKRIEYLKMFWGPYQVHTHKNYFIRLKNLYTIWILSLWSNLKYKILTGPYVSLIFISTKQNKKNIYFPSGFMTNENYCHKICCARKDVTKKRLNLELIILFPIIVQNTKCIRVFHGLVFPIHGSFYLAFNTLHHSHIMSKIYILLIPQIHPLNAAFIFPFIVKINILDSWIRS